MAANQASTMLVRASDMDLMMLRPVVNHPRQSQAWPQVTMNSTPARPRGHQIDTNTPVRRCRELARYN
jgi:hypothetical protein